MTMQRWDPFPFNDAFSLRQVMDRLLEDAFVWPGRATGGGQTGFGIPVDVAEQENELVVRASLPGVRPEDINLTVQGNTLTIEGESREEFEQPQGQQGAGQQATGQQGQGNGQKAQQSQPRYHYRERRFGRFYRQLALPVPVDSNQTQARFDHGVLTITLPKAAEARQRRIAVTGGSQAQPLPAGRAR